MKNTLETRLGLFFALALVVAFIVMEMVGSFDFLKPGIRVRAQFATVQELNEGDPVKMGGKQIGRVELITLTNSRVEVVLKLADTQNVHTDSQAAIRFSGLLGQNYVSLSFGSPTAPLAADNILLQSLEQPDFGTLMSKLDQAADGIEKFANSMPGDQIQDLLGVIMEFMKENRLRLSGIVSNAQVITDRVAAGEGTVGRLINDEALYASALATVTNFNTTATDIQAAIRDVTNVLHSVHHGTGTVGKLINDPALFDNLTNASADLSAILAKINRGTGTVGRIVNDETLYKNVRASLQKLDKATESLEDQGPLSIIGIAVGSLF